MTTATALKTPQAARTLGISYFHLIDMLRAGRVEPPTKDSSGHYLWSAEDLDRARAALKVDRRRKPVPA